ncbi:MAG: hypothetical protein IJV00_04110 [Clostridia bacterium]|nr:hypothetical protein [Clostridia bacterium]
MKLKKINAILSMLTTAAIFVHIGYVAFSFAAMYDNQLLKNLTARPFMAFACLHAIFAMAIVFFSSEGTRLDQYPKQNVGTIIQRATAILILPLLFLHINTFDLLTTCAQTGKWGLFVVLMISQPIFYAVTLAHVSVSVSRALVTLGRLTSIEKKKKVDRIVMIVCAVFFVAASVAVIKGQLSIFLPAGGAQ